MQNIHFFIFSTIINNKNITTIILYIYFFIFYKLYVKIKLGNYSFCVSLIIPSTIKDFSRCNKILKRNLCKSIVHPYEVALIVSGVGYNNHFKIYNATHELEKCTNNLIILSRKLNYNAAENRNYGYFHSHCQIISFFDIDDVMSIYRIFIINKIFKSNKNIDILFHPFSRNLNYFDKQNLSQIYDKYVVTNQYNEITKKCIETYTYDNRIHKCDVSNGFYITNGWPSIRRSIMKYILYNESLYATEDLDFISRIVKSGYRVGIFKKSLGFYIKDFNCSV